MNELREIFNTTVLLNLRSSNGKRNRWLIYYNSSLDDSAGWKEITGLN